MVFKVASASLSLGFVSTMHPCNSVHYNFHEYKGLLRQSYGPPRHPRFGGVYVRRGEGTHGSSFLHCNPWRDSLLGPLAPRSTGSKQARTS